MTPTRIVFSRRSERSVLLGSIKVGFDLAGDGQGRERDADDHTRILDRPPPAASTTAVRSDLVDTRRPSISSSPARQGSRNSPEIRARLRPAASTRRGRTPTRRRARPRRWRPAPVGADQGDLARGDAVRATSDGAPAPWTIAATCSAVSATPGSSATASAAGRSRPAIDRGRRASRGRCASASVNGPIRVRHQHLDQPAAAERLARRRGRSSGCTSRCRNRLPARACGHS